MRKALTIAGSDSGGGAGIQADIKTMEAHGIFACSVITSVTSQNTVEVRDAVDVPAAHVRSQLEAVLDDIDISAAKTGMLSAADIITVVADVLSGGAIENLVVDPVMVSKSGFSLIDEEAVSTMVSRLFPLALVVTPNLDEAARLTGREIGSIDSVDGMKEAARAIAAMGPKAVVVKGGHAGFARATDVLFDGDTFHELRADYVHDGPVHGTGCTFSAAMTAWLAIGDDLDDATVRAKRYVEHAIARCVAVGKGHPVGLFRQG